MITPATTDALGGVQLAGILGGGTATDPTPPNGYITAAMLADVYATAAALANEASRAEAAEASITDAWNAAYQSAITYTNTGLTNETNARVSVDTQLQAEITALQSGSYWVTPAQLSAETSAREAGDTDNANAIAAETVRAKGVEATLAPLASPALTGTPTAPTATALTNSTQISTTAYTDAAVAVETNARTTSVAAEQNRAEGAENTLNTAITDETNRASTAEANLQTAINNETSRAEAEENTLQTDITNETKRAEAAEALLAPLASPALTGTPTAPTAAALTNDTQISTTAYTDSAVAVEKARAEAAESSNSSSISSETTRAEAAEANLQTNITNETNRAEAAEALLAPIASPTFTGTPDAPTAAPLTNDTQIATTAYADAAVSVEKTRAESAESTNATNITNETSRAEAAESNLQTNITNETNRAEAAEALLAPKASPTFTGIPVAPTAAPLTNDTQVATTAYADAAVAVETARAESAESSNSSSISAETTRAEAAEANLQTDINNETSRAEAAEALLQPLSQKGQPSGYAELDGNAEVPMSEINMTGITVASGQGYVPSATLSGTQLTVDVSSNWGIHNGQPYYDASGAAAGEAATFTIDPESGLPRLTLIAPSDAQGETAVTYTETLQLGNITGTHTLDFASVYNHHMVVQATLTGNTVFVLENREPGCEAILLLTQDSVGGHTISVSDGSNAQLVNITPTAGGSTIIQTICPDSAEIWVTNLSAPVLPDTVVTGNQILAGNLGANYTLSLGGVANERTLLSGTLNANCDITITGAAPGSSVLLLLTQNAAGANTLTLTDGEGNSSPITINQTGGSSTTIQIDSPDGKVLSVNSDALPEAVLTVAQLAANVSGSTITESGLPESVQSASSAYTTATARGQTALVVKGGTPGVNVLTGHLHASDYGFVADGTTDNSTAWANIISAANTTGAPIWLDFEGNANIATATGSALPSGLQMRGNSMYRTSLTYTDTGTFLDFTGTANIHFEDFTITIPATSNKVTAVYFSGNFRCSLKSIRIDGPYTSVSNLGTGYGVELRNNSGDNRFIDCEFNNLYCGVATSSIQNYFIGCIWGTNYRHVWNDQLNGYEGGIVIHAGTMVSSSVLTPDAIRIDYSSNNYWISGLWIEGCQYGLNIQGDALNLQWSGGEIAATYACLNISNSINLILQGLNLETGSSSSNGPVATVSAGGTTAPAAGTIETWTVNVSSTTPMPFSAVPIVLNDPAVSGEYMLVTAITGTSWTVERGYSGSTPAAHAGGFTVTQTPIDLMYNDTTANRGTVINCHSYLNPQDGLTPWDTSTSASHLPTHWNVLYNSSAVFGGHVSTSSIISPKGLTVTNEGPSDVALLVQGAPGQSTNIAEIGGLTVDQYSNVIAGGGLYAGASICPNVGQATMNGTTAGSAVSSQPFAGTAYKKVMVYLNGYENTTTTAQTITFPTAFIDTPYLARDDSGGATVSTTTLTLPASMAAATTGWIVIEGF